MNKHYTEILILLDIPQIHLGIKGALVWSKMFNKLLSRALSDKGQLFSLSVIPDGFKLDPDEQKLVELLKEWPKVGVFGNQVCASFLVVDRGEGLVLICNELRSIELLNCAQIAWNNSDEWVTFYPTQGGLSGSKIQQITASILTEIYDAIEANGRTSPPGI